MYCQRLFSFVSLLFQVENAALNKFYSTLHVILIIYGLYKGTILKSVLSLALFPTSCRVLVLSGNQKELRRGKCTHHKFLRICTYGELVGHDRDVFTVYQ